MYRYMFKHVQPSSILAFDFVTSGASSELMLYVES